MTDQAGTIYYLCVEVIKRERKTREWTWEELGAYCGLRGDTIRRWAHGATNARFRQVEGVLHSLGYRLSIAVNEHAYTVTPTRGPISCTTPSLPFTSTKDLGMEQAARKLHQSR